MAGRPEVLALASLLVLVAWSSSWFEITAAGTYTEGLEREPTIKTEYSIDKELQTFEISIENATPLLLYWMQREEVDAPDDAIGNPNDGDDAPKDEPEKSGEEGPCSGECLELARNSIALLMTSFVASLGAASLYPRRLTKAIAGVLWTICLVVIVLGVPLSAVADFGIFSGGEGDSEGSSTGGFDSETTDSVSVDQFAHFSSRTGQSVSLEGILFSYDSVGFDLGLLDEDERQSVIENAPKEGDPGYDSLIRFHGEVVAGPGSIVSCWFLTLPLMVYGLIGMSPEDEEE